MPGSSGDDNDSRTASVGGQRTRGNGSTEPSRQNSQDPISNANNKKRRRGKTGDRETRDFVPQGGSFSANPLQVDPDSTSSSGSDSSSDKEESDNSDDGSADPSKDNPHAGSTAPAINWNKGRKSAVRTTLGGRANKAAESKPVSQFDAVNGKYWRSGSASASSDAEEAKNRDEDMEEGEVDESSAGSDQMHDSGDSDDSESLGSEADDSIMLNIGSRSQGNSPSKNQNGQASLDNDGSDPEARPASLLNGSASHAQNGIIETPVQTKEGALQSFSKRYPTAPTALADLERKDMEVQARFMFYDRDINDIDLQLPVACTECLREGHLAEVCPSRECVHCGAWNQHQSSFCPSWRRCQKCRERGHDEARCTSPLKGSASETPCDLCGSPEHLELQCDNMWKIPRPVPSSGSVFVSISCSHCASNRHIMGDCPSLPRPILSSSWTLKGLDESLVTNTNSVVGARRGGAPMTRGQRGNGGMKIRGRADQRSPSPDSDDMMSRPGQRPPIGRNNSNRPNIRIGSGIGKNKNLGPGGPDYDSRRDYRDRQDYYGNHSRQRSMSPNTRPGRGRGRDSWQPAPRSPPRGRGRPAPRNTRGGDRGGRGGGRGNKRGGNGDAYRPMPSSGKKAWDKYRL
ncbi:hypothetical protein ASPWEDRAFT_22589 [Aspergillus wentii DTO 134E9]|uniref:CCHC-type domain-containing protein n=1 Tax=Aspergillus wentii DTO 134E9 TaxID=1073089 RepID=A0A1L9RZZ1_ASPWE|nr:uncharacterized protein ASPWEDRAFT_22589 [Aspergillus wentii DTO 134E9]OJJ40407.1 hypothetical protein ASPWEDRAFT_22589 [Aspergillus wentii DTO 134E9]